MPLKALPSTKRRYLSSGLDGVQAGCMDDFDETTRKIAWMPTVNRRRGEKQQRHAVRFDAKPQGVGMNIWLMQDGIGAQSTMRV